VWLIAQKHEKVAAQNRNFRIKKQIRFDNWLQKQYNGSKFIRVSTAIIS
jgi:hypothetical protein